MGCRTPFSPYWLSWSNGYDICLPNFKMLAEDPSSILGGSTGTWKISGTTFSFFHETPRPDLLLSNSRSVGQFSPRSPKTMAGKKKNCNCRNSRCLKL